jgi:histone-lysine N-methyltransferase SETD3
MESNIDLDAPKHVYIMLFMLIDRKQENSFFKPYYDILPPTLHNMPIFWSPEELEMLAGSHMLTQIDERNDAIGNDYIQICELDPDFAHVCTLEEFKWARMCVSSRNFGMQINGIRTAAMVPFADMLNHYRPRETKWQFEDSSQSFTVVSLQEIVAGAQVYDSYGQKCNHRFLLNYGFSVETNIEPDGFCPNEVSGFH